MATTATSRSRSSASSAPPGQSGPESAVQMRIRRAYKDEDASASISAHDEMLESGPSAAAETHAGAGAGDVVKSLVFGGLDGIITTFAIVAAVAGAGLSTNTVIVMGVANLVADGLSMGLGDFLSEQAEQNFIKHEFEREKWELRNYPQGEFREMVDIYVRKKGFTEEDAEALMTILFKYPKAFVEMMCVDELGFIAPDDGDGGEDDGFPAWKKGVVTMLAFDLFGAVPVAVYVLAKVLSPTGDPPKNVVFAVAAVATGCTLFALGVTKATFTKQNALNAGVTMLANGSCAAAAAYGIGALLETILHASACR